MRESTERDFEAYGKLLENVSDFKYMGRVMTARDEDWPAVAGNLLKARKSWGRLSQIICREGVDARVSGKFFKALVQAVLLFRAETWVLTPRMKRALDIFQHGAMRRLTGRQPWRRGYGRWVYPPMSEAMEEAGFEEIGV